MIRILTLYYSSYGHTEKMAQAIAEGVREVNDAEVVVKRVPETMPEDVAKNAGVKLEQEAPLADPAELAEYDAVIFGTPTRFGNMAGQMRNFLDQTGPLWKNGSLVGKVASVFTSSNTQHGGQESTILTFHPTLLHLGMVIVGLPYTAEGQTTTEEISGGSPYGASTVAGANDERPSKNEMELARFQGRHVAQITSKLAA
jgi:NAD(P)H dehydrogenase (quinone)